jgi:hypothetical protein
MQQEPCPFKINIYKAVLYDLRLSDAKYKSSGLRVAKNVQWRERGKK